MYFKGYKTIFYLSPNYSLVFSKLNGFIMEMETSLLPASVLSDKILIIALKI